KRSAAHCRAPHGGAACVDPFVESCCPEINQACADGTCGTTCGASAAPECGGRCPDPLHNSCVPDCTTDGHCQCVSGTGLTCGSCQYPNCTGFCVGRTYCVPHRAVDAQGTEVSRSCGCTSVNAPECGFGPFGACPPGQVCTTFLATGETRCTPL